MSQLSVISGAPQHFFLLVTAAYGVFSSSQLDPDAQLIHTINFLIITIVIIVINLHRTLRLRSIWTSSCLYRFSNTLALATLRLPRIHSFFL